jgi:hypothetical protein
MEMVACHLKKIINKKENEVTEQQLDFWEIKK